jgi:hypothetical protein
MEMEDAVVGRLYRVEWHDCCSEGRFEAVLAAADYAVYQGPGPEPELFLDGLTFVNGVTISGHGVVLTELP